MIILQRWRITIIKEKTVKKTNKAILMILGLVLSISMIGCGNGDNNGKVFKDTKKLSVVTTIYPMYDFASNIAGDKAEIINLVPAGTEPHDFELSTGDMQLLEQADLFIYNGADMEHFVDKTIDAISNENLTVVETAKDVATIKGAHSHEEGEKEEHHDEEEAEEIDPHTWLSIENAMIQAEAIKDALISIDAENADYYEDNFAEYKSKLDTLYERYKSELSDLSSNKIVVAHEAFGYLCNEFGLEQEAVEGLTAESEPDAARMKEIIEFCKENNIKVIFFEELVSPKVANTIADEIGATTMVLNPIEGLTAQQEEEGLDYIGLMEQNLEALKSALK